MAKLDFPNVSCEQCSEALRIDDVEPPCFKEGGRGQGSRVSEEIPGVNSCWIPQPDERGQRILEIRAKIIKLRDLIDPAAILRLYRATIEDIELLAFVEEEMKKLKEKDKDS